MRIVAPIQWEAWCVMMWLVLAKEKVKSAPRVKMECSNTTIVVLMHPILTPSAVTNDRPRKWSCNRCWPMKGLKKNCMGRGHTNTHTRYGRTSRLYERIGLRAASLKTTPWDYNCIKKNIQKSFISMYLYFNSTFMKQSLDSLITKLTLINKF